MNHIKIWLKFWDLRKISNNEYSKIGQAQGKLTISVRNQYQPILQPLSNTLIIVCEMKDSHINK